jgi:hypothetical protein
MCSLAEQLVSSLQRFISSKLLMTVDFCKCMVLLRCGQRLNFGATIKCRVESVACFGVNYIV